MATGGPRTILELVLAVLMVGLMVVRVRHNRGAIELEDMRRHQQP